MLHDAHNHLQDDTLAPHLDRIAASWDPTRFGFMVVNGTCEADWPRVTTLAQRYPFVRPSYGLHPWDAGDRSPDWFNTLKTHLDANPHAAVGEIGIDRWILDSARPDDPRLAGQRRAPLPEQGEVFLKQLALACTENRPVTIHCLQAWGALSEIIARVNVPERGFLLHAYGGPVELVSSFAKRGAYFSFNGAFLDPKHSKHQAAFKAVPLDRLLVETDAPAMIPPQLWRTHKLPPAPDGSSVNHPGNIESAYAGLASLLGIPLPELTAQVDTNFHHLFGP
ncbi:MAG: TatD family hydrolase [Opitutaceae bacterium]|jgi:TatD DNase family protein